MQSTASPTSSWGPNVTQEPNERRSPSGPSGRAVGTPCPLGLSRLLDMRTVVGDDYVVTRPAYEEREARRPDVERTPPSPPSALREGPLERGRLRVPGRSTAPSLDLGVSEQPLRARPLGCSRASSSATSRSRSSMSRLAALGLQRPLIVNTRAKKMTMPPMHTHHHLFHSFGDAF